MKMGKYCKAYLLSRFREFPGWSEQSQNARKEPQTVDEQEVEMPRELTDDAIVYLQENLVVTDGIAIDEHILFDHITPEWEEFCTKTLEFAIPDFCAETGEDAEEATVEPAT